MTPLRSAGIYANAARQYLLRNYWDPSSPDAADEAEFDAVLDDYDDAEAVFVHAGLSDVRSAFGGDPYEFLLGKLTDHFESVMAPGFTPSFRQSGVYHKLYSRPQYGTFARLFLEDATYRTDDAIHSILVAGDYRFDDCDHHRSFGPSGCWAKLDRGNVLVMNVGTNFLVTTQFHHVEQRTDVPYYATAEHEGELYRDETSHESITQTNYSYDRLCKFNRRKIERDLRRDGVLDRRDVGGLRVRFVRAGDLRRSLADRIATDPYYLVS